MADQIDPPTDEQVAALDAARQAVIAEQSDTDKQRAFFEALYALPGWYVLAGASPNTEQPSAMPPLVTVSDSQGRRIMPVFSSVERAKAQHGVMYQNQEGETPEVNVITLPVAMGMAYLCHVYDDVPFAIFDNVTGEHDGFGIDVKALPSWYDNVAGPCPVECLKVMSRVASETQQAGAYASCFRSIIAHDRVIVARRADGALLVANEGGKVFVPVFSTDGMAQTLTENTENIELQAAPASALLPTLRQLRESITQDGFIGVVFDPGHATLVLHEQLWEQAEASLKNDAG